MGKKSIVVYKELLILSEENAKARRIRFNDDSNVIFGVNETGKSRIIKNILWALGCEVPLRIAGSFDKNAAVLLIISLDGLPFAFYRNGKHQIIHDLNSKKNIYSTHSGVEWSSIFSIFFNIDLKLQRHEEGGYDFAGPEYILLPSYIDQDSSWGSKWTTFSNLTQFSNWQSTVFDFVTGAKNSSYLEWKVKYDECVTLSKELKRQIKVSEIYHENVLSLLPEKKIEINVDGFNKEMGKITFRINEATKKQEDIKGELYDYSLKITKLQQELSLARKAEKDTFSDINYLTDIPDGGLLECPTCGVKHEVSISARVDLTLEHENLHTFIIETKNKLNKIKEKKKKLKDDYDIVIRELKELNEFTQTNGPVVDVSFNDVINSNSSDILTHALKVTVTVIEKKIGAVTDEANQCKSMMHRYSDASHEQYVRDNVSLMHREYSKALKISDHDIAKNILLHRKPVTTGSSGPRSILALHCCIIAVAQRNTNIPAFPFIVDTPQQSGQDEINLSRMLDVSLSMSKIVGQTIVATESMPKNWKPGSANIIHLGERKGLLKPDEYQEVLEIMRNVLYAESES